MRRVLGDRRPGLVIAAAREAGQDDHAARQLGDRGDEIGDRRHAAGDAGGDHRMGRRHGGASAAACAAQHAVAPLGGIEAAVAGERVRPVLAHDVEEAEHLLPMLGMLIGDERSELVERCRLRPDTSSRKRASSAASGAAWPGASGPVPCAAAPGEDEPRQQQPAAQLRHGGRDVDSIRAALRRRGSRARRRRDRPPARGAAAAARGPRSRAGTPRASARARRAASAAEWCMRASASGSPPDSARSPAARHRGTARRAGWCRAAPRSALDPVRVEPRLGERQSGRRADMEPFAVMDDAGDAARRDRPVP